MVLLVSNSSYDTEYKVESYRWPQCATCWCGNTNCNGKTSNGVKWYRVEGWRGSWGFANGESKINLYNTDVYRGDRDDQRLSLHVNDNHLNWQGSFYGASRCGATEEVYNTGEECLPDVNILPMIPKYCPQSSLSAPLPQGKNLRQFALNFLVAQLLL